MASKEEIIAFQDRLKANFSHRGVVGGRLLKETMDREVVAGEAFCGKFYGHRLLTDSFLEFFAETLEEQFTLNKENWPQDLPSYANCLLMYIIMYRSVRVSELLSLHGYTLKAYSAQRTIKEQLWALCAAANHMASFTALFGYEGLGDGSWTDEQKKQIFYNRLAVEKDVREQICGKQSGLSEETQGQLLNWERLFNQEVHRGLLSFFRASHRLYVEKHYELELVPPMDDLSDAMFLNRSMETNWMALKLLPFMRRPDTPENKVWRDKWVVMDESFEFMFRGFSELGKKIAPAFEEMLKAKFAFNADTRYSEGKDNVAGAIE